MAVASECTLVFGAALGAAATGGEPRSKSCKLGPLAEGVAEDVGVSHGPTGMGLSLARRKRSVCEPGTCTGGGGSTAAREVAAPLGFAVSMVFAKKPNMRGRVYHGF